MVKKIPSLTLPKHLWTWLCKLSINVRCLYYGGVQNNEFAYIYHWLWLLSLDFVNRKVYLVLKLCYKKVPWVTKHYWSSFVFNYAFNKPMTCITLNMWYNNTCIWEEEKNVENKSHRRVFSICLECSQMCGVFYHSVILSWLRLLHLIYDIDIM